MKLTAKITSIIALILTMTMVLTGCSMLEEILNQILGTEEPPVVVEPSGYTISAENADGTLYFSGSVSEGRFNGSYRDKFATLVNLTKVDGGFIIHFVDESETIQYIVMDDSAAGGALTTDKFEATIFEWNEDVHTYVVADDNNNRAFGVGKDSTYTTFSCYDVSNTTYNYAKFTPVNDPVIENGEGGKPTGGGSEGGNGGSTAGFGVIDTPVAGTAYKFGMVQTAAGGTHYLAGGMDGYYMATTTEADSAIDVYLEEVSGGYHLYCMVGGAKTYINATKVIGSDGKEHVNGTYDATALTVYTYDATLKTLVVTIGDATYAFGTRNDKTYTTVGPCDVSKDPFICQFYGVGGTTSGGNNSGNEGGNNGGNQGGNTDNPFAGGFELSLVPAYSSNYGGYYVINNDTPYFTAEEIATAKAGCFEYYAERDSLGRATLAYACVCNNTLPKDSRGDISSVKPTGWVQKTYDIVPGGSLYNRSHLIAWSLTDEDANWENLVTGTEHMNQKVMTQFEDIVRDYVKANSNNKVLYRVTPIYNGNNLVCTGILLEAYSLDDNGDDIMFCVFIYNVQPGISIDYATGKSELGDEAGKNSGLAGSIADGGNGGSNDEIVDTDIPNNTITDNKVNITVDTLGIPSQSYVEGKAMFSSTELAFVQIGNYGYGVQMRDKDGNTSIIWNNTALPGAIAKIELTYSSTKDISYSNPDAVIFSFGNSKDNLTYVTKLSTTAGTKTYTITPDGDYTFFKMEHDLGYSFYWDSIVIVLVDGTEIPGGNNGNEGGTTTPAHTCESVCDECCKCEDATCTEAACADKCQGHETVDPNPGTGDTVELESYSHKMAKNDFTANGTATLSGLKWTLDGDGGYWGWDNNNVKGIQLGSKNNPYKTMTLTSASVSNVKKIVISTCGASSISGTLTVTVNGVQVGDTITLTATNTEYTFELDEATTGEIVFTYTQTSSKAFYINTITIYTEK